MDYIKSLQALHCRAGRLIFNLPRDTPSEEVMELTKRGSRGTLDPLLNSHNGTGFMICTKSPLTILQHIVSDNMPSTISDLAVWRNSPYDLRGYKKAVVP